MSYYARLLEHAANHPAREAIRSDDVSIGYGELIERVEAAARGLAASGIGSDSTVGLTIADEVDNFIATLALVRAGARQITLATHDTATFRAEIARRAQVTHLVAADAVPITDGLPVVDWPPPLSSRPLGEGADGGFFFRTSGTTGSSNLVPLEGSDIAAQSEHTPEYAGARLFRPASVEHNNGKRHRLYCAYMGGTNVFRSSPRDVDVAALCLRHGVGRMDLSLMHAAGLVARNVWLEGVDLYVGGSAVPLELRRAIEDKVTRKLHVRYAATEAGAISICRPGEHEDGNPVGRPVPGIRLQIVDDGGRVLPAGEAGNIRVLGEGVATRYFDEPEQTARRFRDGWFWPGDMGTIESDGRLSFLGRADEMIVLNGINIFPVELERELEQHPAVLAAAALPIPSSVHGQIPVAAVELTAGSEVTTRELLLFARERLALRAPRRIMIVEALPRNGQGKVLRRELAARFSMPKESQ